jgi:hypothetical protein
MSDDLGRSAVVASAELTGPHSRVVVECPIRLVDLPPELYAYRAGRNAQQAVIEVEERLFRGHPEVVDADLADYTQVATAVQQGAANFRCVRVTDGTDTAAAFEVPSTSFVLTALYTGTLGNQITVALGTGSKARTWRLTVVLPEMTPEVYDNIGGAGTSFW